MSFLTSIAHTDGYISQSDHMLKWCVFNVVISNWDQIDIFAGWFLIHLLTVHVLPAQHQFPLNSFLSIMPLSIMQSSWWSSQVRVPIKAKVTSTPISVASAWCWDFKLYCGDQHPNPSVGFSLTMLNFHHTAMNDLLLKIFFITQVSLFRLPVNPNWAKKWDMWSFES